MDSQDENLILNNKKKYSSATIAANLAIKKKISSSKATNICGTIKEEGVDIPTSSQVGV